MKYTFVSEFNHYFLVMHFESLKESKIFNQKFLSHANFNPQYSRIENSNGKIVLSNPNSDLISSKSEKEELIDYCNFKFPEYSVFYSTQLEFHLKNFNGFPIMEFSSGFPDEHFNVSDSGIRENELDRASIRVKDALDEFKVKYGDDFAWCFYYNTNSKPGKPLLSMGGLKNVGMLIIRPIDLIEKLEILYKLRIAL